MNFRKKISLGVISAVCAFAFVACGNNTSMPKCGDKDVQEGLREAMLKEMLKEMLNDSESKNIDRKDLEKFAKSTKFQNIITEATDEARKKVTCKANETIDVDTVKDFMYLGANAEIANLDLVLKSGEKLTEKNIEEIFVRTAEKKHISDGMSKSQKEEIRKEAKEKAKEMKEGLLEMAEEIAKGERELKYTAQRTDDGKLIVKELKDHDE